MIDLIGRSTWISLFRVSEQSDTVVPVVPPPAQGGKHYHKWPMVVLAPSGCYTCATSVTSLQHVLAEIGDTV